MNTGSAITVKTACRERAVLVVVAMSLVVRLSIFLLGHPFPPLENDDSVYDALAVNLVEGHGFSMSRVPPYEPMPTRPPGYPAFLAAVYGVVGHHVDAVRLAQILLGSATCVLIYVLARRLVAPTGAVLAAALYATLPAAAHYPSLILTESLHAFLLTATVYLMYRCLEDDGDTMGWYAACGLVLGVAVLVRPDYQLLLVPLVGVALLLKRWTLQLWLRLGVMAVCVVMVVGPWVTRNYLVFGRFIGVASGSGHALMTAKLEAEGLTGRALMDAFRERYGVQFREKYHREMTFLDGALPDQDELRRRDFLVFVESEPETYAKHTMLRLATFWGPRSWSDSVGLDGDFSEYRRSGALFPLGIKSLMLAWDAVVLAFAFAGAAMAVGQWRRILPIAAVVVYATAIHSLVYAGARYRVPLLPFVAILAAIGVQGTLLLVRNRPARLSTLFVSQGGAA